MPKAPSLRKFRYRGLTVVHDPVPGPITALALDVRAGARFDGRIPGLAHMTEHMLFQGTDSLDQLAINHRAAELGGNHNANTGYDTISLTLEVFNEDLEAALGLLFEQFYRSRVDPARFRKEKRVVLDEIRGVQDDPIDRLQEKAWERFFGDPIGHPICGTLSSVRSMVPADVVAFLRRQLVNANAVLSVVGGAPLEVLRQALRRHVVADRMGRPARAGVVRRGESGQIVKRADPGGQSFVLKMFEVPADPASLLATGVVLDLVGADPDSHLFQAVRERHGLGYDVSAELEFGDGWAAALLSGSAHPGQARTLAAVIDEVVAEAARSGFDAAQVARARKKRRYRYALLGERRLERAYARADSVLHRLPGPEEAQRLVDRLDDEAVHAAMRRLAAGRRLTAMLAG